MKRVYTYGYNVGSYTIEYTDGTVLEMSYTNDWNEVYECIQCAEGDYTICIDLRFGGSDNGCLLNGYNYFGDMYWDVWSHYTTLRLQQWYISLAMCVLTARIVNVQIVYGYLYILCICLQRL